MTVSGTIDKTELQTDFDVKRGTLLSTQQAGSRNHRIALDCYAVESDTDLSLRSVSFTPNDDQQLKLLALETHGHATTALTTTAVLEEIDAISGDVIGGVFPDDALSVTNSTTDATETHARTQWTTSTDTLYTLRKGHTYRLSVTSSDDTDAATRLRAVIVVGILRRRG